MKGWICWEAFSCSFQKNPLQNGLTSQRVYNITLTDIGGAWGLVRQDWAWFPHHHFGSILHSWGWHILNTQHPAPEAPICLAFSMRRKLFSEAPPWLPLRNHWPGGVTCSFLNQSLARGIPTIHFKEWRSLLGSEPHGKGMDRSFKSGLCSREKQGRDKGWQVSVSSNNFSSYISYLLWLFSALKQSWSKVQSIILLRTSGQTSVHGPALMKVDTDCGSAHTFCILLSWSFHCFAAKAGVNGCKGRWWGSPMSHQLAVQASVLLAKCRLSRATVVLTKPRGGEQLWISTGPRCSSVRKDNRLV